MRSRLGDGRAVPALAAVTLFVWLFCSAWLRARAGLGRYDLGYFRQAAWLIAHGRPAFVTLRGLYLLGDHASPAFYPVAAATRVLPPVGTLLAVQAGALALATVPLFAICRRLAGLSVAASAVVVAAYGLHPALHNVNLADFHPEAMAVPALLGAVLFAMTRRWLPYAACVAVALLCKEDFTIVVASLGLFLALERRVRAGLITAAVALVWFFVDTRFIQPHFAGGFVQTAFLGRYGSGMGDIVRTMALHPLRVVGDLATAQNLDFVVALLAPVIFLPAMAPRFLLPAVPMQVLYLLSDRPAAHGIGGQYTVAAIGFVAVATAMSLGGRHGPVAPPRKVLGALLVAALAFNAALSNGGLGHSPWRWRHQDALQKARLAAARVVPPSAAVAASEAMWPLLADRRDLYNFPGPFEGYDARNDPVPLPRRQAATMWMAVDTADGRQWTEEKRAAFARLVPALGFQVVFSRHDVLVLRR